MKREIKKQELERGERTRNRERKKMKSTAKNSRNREKWGMEFLLVFFPEGPEPISMNPKIQPSKLPFSQTSPSPSPSRLLRRVYSSNLLNRAQSTISICAILVFLSLLVFTLSTFDPPSHTSAASAASRRRLSSNLQIPRKSTPFRIPSFNFWKPNSQSNPKPKNSIHALQGMGKLHRRGTRAMTELTVAHVGDSVTTQELRLFLRTLHRSGLTSKSDIVLLFNPSSSSNSSIQTVVMEENDSFSKLVTRVKSSSNSNSSSGLDPTQFMKSGKEWGEPIWGRKIRTNYSGEGGNESTRLSFGSVVSFTTDELDPENSLAGFLDQVPMSLRRWAAYPMLLGRLRRKFKHTALIDAREILVIADPLGRVRTESPESVLLFTESETATKHGRKNSGKSQPRVIPGLILGGERGVRRLSASMLTEIVRVAAGSHRKKKKNSVTEAGVFEQLVRNEHLLKSMDVVSWTESIAVVSSLNPNSDSSTDSPLKQKAVAIRGNSNGETMTSALLNQTCQLESDLTVYSEC